LRKQWSIFLACVIIAGAGIPLTVFVVLPIFQNANPTPNPDPFANVLTNLTLHNPINLLGDAEVDALFSGNNSDGQSWATAYVLDHVAINQTSNEGGEIPIELETSRYIIIRDCYLEGSEYNPAILLQFCEHVMVEHCVIVSGSDGIELYECHFMNVTNNMFWNNYGFDLDLHLVFQSTFAGNQMIGNGVSFFPYNGDDLDSYNLTVGETNTVNGFPISYHDGEDGVQITGGTYAQILLIDCNNSQVNAVTLKEYQNALFVENCTNVTIDGATAINQCLSDIFAFQNSNNTSIQNCDVENAGSKEIGMGDCVNATISNNQILNSQNMNVYLAVCDNVTISNNHISNATWEGGISIYTCSNVAVLDNNISTPVLTNLNVVSDNQMLVVWDSIGISVQGNTLNGFFYFKNTYNITCDSTNTLNGRRLYYYENLTGAEISGVDGAILLQSCQWCLLTQLSTNCTIVLADCIQCKISNCSILPGSYVFLVSCSDCTISGCAFTNCSLYLEWATTNYVCYNQFTDTSVAITSVAYYSHVDNNTFCGLNASLTKDSETEASGNTFNSTCLGEQANPNVASVVFWAALGTAAGVILGIAALIIRKKKKQIIKNTEYSCDKTENNTRLD